jgi:hypothetical protein
MLGEKIVVLFPLCKDVRVDSLHSYFGKKQNIIVCDFHVKDIHKKTFISCGYLFENIINIDHHAPDSFMANFATATSLASEYRKSDFFSKNSIVVINHTDCDSMLSALIVSSQILPDEMLCQAALAADHTGNENDIADLLQSMEHLRDFVYSQRNLHKLLSRNRLDEEASKLFLDRKLQRDYACKISQKAERIGFVHLIKLSPNYSINIQLFKSFLPDACIIMSSQPMCDNHDRNEISIMLGQKAPADLYLNNIPLPNEFGCRWNAGSNKRSSGSTVQPHEYINIINSYMAVFSKNK